MGHLARMQTLPFFFFFFYPSIIDYNTAHDRHISCFRVPFLLVCYSFIRVTCTCIAVGVFFVTGVPIDEIRPFTKGQLTFLVYQDIKC